MCIIAVCEKGMKLDKEKFDRCFNHNSHGFGMAWIENDQLFFSKGFMKLDEAYPEYLKHCDNAHVAHFRLTSAGETCPELTHPFVVSDLSTIALSDRGTDLKVLFHNGTISFWENKVFTLAVKAGAYPDGQMSDSRMAAMAVNAVGEKVLDTFSGKFVIAGKAGFTLYGEFEEGEDGILYSNSGYKAWTPITYSGNRYFGRGQDDTNLELYNIQDNDIADTRISTAGIGSQMMDLLFPNISKTTPVKLLEAERRFEEKEKHKQDKRDKKERNKFRFGNH